MVYLYRVIVALLLAVTGLAAHADGGPFPAPHSWGFGSGNGVADSFSSACSAGVNYVQSLQPSCTYYGSPCTWQANMDGGICQAIRNGNTTYGVSVSATCPAGATASTGSSGEAVCTCTAGLRPSNGQCVALPACPEGQHEEGGACVPNNCTGEQTRVNGICVDPPPCPAGQVRVAGKCKVPDKCPKPGTLAGEYRVKNTTPTSMCEAGCVVSITGFVRAVKDGKVVETVGMGYYTGGECNGPSEPPDPDSDGGNGDGGGDDGGDGGDDGGGDDGGGDGGTGPGPGGGGTGPGTGPGGNNNDPDKPEKCPNGKCSGDGEGGGDEGGPTNPPPASEYLSPP